MMNRILPVTDKKTFRDFVAVPVKLQAADPHFIPRLDFEMNEHLSPKNPFFDHAQHCFFVAYNDNGPAGRVSAQIDTLAQKDGAPLAGHFGMIEAADEQTLGDLLQAAEGWLKEQGAAHVTGPFSLSINDESGLLVEGFDTPPRLMMNHAPGWYGKAIEATGYQKAMDLLAYKVGVNGELPKAAQRMAEEAAKLENLIERPIDMKNFREELGVLIDIFNDAWRDNWGFVPMTSAEVNYMAANMRPVIVPELARFAFIDGKPAAMIVALPDVNEAIADLNGKLLPFGWAKLIWRLKVRGLKGARVLLMGVRQEYQGGIMGAGLSALLVQRLQEAAQNLGYEEIEMSWVLEDNKPTDRLIRSVGGEPYKRYRLYEKDVA